MAPHPLAVWHHNRNLAQNNNVFWLILLVKFSIRNELDMKKGAQDDHSEAVEVFTKKKEFKICEPSNKKRKVAPVLQKCSIRTCTDNIS